MLTSAVVYFTWRPPAAGHKWVNAQLVADDWSIGADSGPVLAPRGFPMYWKLYAKPEAEYQPLEVASGLFRELAALAPTPEAILPFADQYGPLTSGRLFVPEGKKVRASKPPLPRTHAEHLILPRNIPTEEHTKWTGQWFLRGVVMGDSLEYWRENILALKALVSLWDALGKRDRKGIEQVARLEWQGTKRVITLCDESGRELDAPLTFDEASSAKLSLFVAAEHALIDALARLTTDGSSLSLFPPESYERHKLAIVPRSLRDAIWLQFALAVLEHKTFRACEICGKHFEVSPQVARTNRTLCSAACKARAHRKRRDQALKLAGEGHNAKQIAKRVGSQLTTVQKWLAQAKE